MSDLLRFLAGPEASAARARWRRARTDPPPDPVRVSAELRSAVPGSLARALAEQILLEERAAAKLGDPARMLFERIALEQATSLGCAAWHAASVPRGARVVDAGCGLGADTLAFAAAGCRVAGVELDPHRAGLARHNLAVAAASGAGIVRGDATRLPARGDILFVDPDRRATGRRTVDLGVGVPEQKRTEGVEIVVCQRRQRGVERW